MPKKIQTHVYLDTETCTIELYITSVMSFPIVMCWYHASMFMSMANSQ